MHHLMAFARSTRTAQLLVGGHQVGAAVRGVVIAVLVRHGVHGTPVLAHGLRGASGVVRGLLLLSEGVWSEGVWRGFASVGAERGSEPVRWLSLPRMGRSGWTGGWRRPGKLWLKFGLGKSRRPMSRFAKDGRTPDEGPSPIYINPSTSIPRPPVPVVRNDKRTTSQPQKPPHPLGMGPGIISLPS